MMTDIEIAQKAHMLPIIDIAAALTVDAQDILLYGAYKAKLTLKKTRELIACAQNGKRGKLILVTAITPTPAGEGKTTVSIGLADALRKIGKKSVAALREPSLGPCFGIKGGAAGGGHSQMVPMEDINLHFTGDIHAVSIANNLIASLIDNHIQQGNALGIDSRTISWKRCVDLNDRALRRVIVGLGGTLEGVPREDGFTIAVASEIMAILCLSRSISELKERLNQIVIGQRHDSSFVTLRELGVTGAVAAVLKDALCPNIVQTLENTPALVHGGPFANIAHGCNSINATLCALALGDYVVTEAGFAADLGAEKFMDIKCRIAGIAPDAAVIVATIRALKMHGGLAKNELNEPDCAALERGFDNLKTHLENMRTFGVPTVVAVNRFSADSAEEISLLQSLVQAQGAQAILCDGWGKGGDGVIELAEHTVQLCEEKNNFHQLYPLDMPLDQKITCIAQTVYRAQRVEFSPLARKKLARYTDCGYGHLPVCIAKTQNSISHDKTLIGAPKGFIFPVRDVQLYAGAGFVTALAGDIVTMPSLPKIPAAHAIDVDEDGVISGLF